MLAATNTVVERADSRKKMPKKIRTELITFPIVHANYAISSLPFIVGVTVVACHQYLAAKSSILVGTLELSPFG
jgi:hypothetical protein